MIDKDKNGLFLMVVGIPSSGKTYYCENEFQRYYDAEYISSDALREEMYGSADDQSHNAQVFAEMLKRTKDALLMGYNVVYDATNLISKRRRQLLRELPPCYKKCVIVAAPVAECIARDAKRQRKVGRKVIERMMRQFEMPYMEEGWDKISIINNSKNGYSLQSFLNEFHDMDQNSPWHSHTLGEHMDLTAKAMDEQIDEASWKWYYDEWQIKVLRAAAQYHDCGKPWTKTTDDKGVSHYYAHQNVGAYIALCDKSFTEQERILLAFLICYHMYDYSWGKKVDEIMSKLSGTKQEFLLRLHECDKLSQRDE